MDRLKSLEFFIRLVEKKGIAAAGKDFGMSPATASDRLASLEAHYGAKLINRTTRSISLTDEGKRLLKGARDLVNDSQNLESQIRLGMERISGPIKMSASQDLGYSLISSMLVEFTKLHPAVQIELLAEDKSLDLVNHSIDLAIRLGSNRDSSLRRRKLGDNRRIVCASPDYLAVHGTPQHPKELAEHNCLVMHWGHVIDREWAFKIKGRKASVPVSGNLSSHSGLQVKKWCLDGHGIAFKSIWDVKQHLQSGALVELFKDYRCTEDSSVQILFPGGGKPSQRVTILIEYLVAAFKQMSDVPSE